MFFSNQQSSLLLLLLLFTSFPTPPIAKPGLVSSEAPVKVRILETWRQDRAQDMASPFPSDCEQSGWPPGAAKARSGSRGLRRLGLPRARADSTPGPCQPSAEPTASKTTCRSPRNGKAQLSLSCQRGAQGQRAGTHAGL